MKITGNAVTVTSTLAGVESHLCDIDPAGMAQMIYTFTHLYSDTKRAVIREYVANGIDATRQAGSDRPVELELPGALSSGVTIRDHGVGLSRDDIVTVYGRYWSSTKRDDPDQIGWFGLGAKSAFTVTTQFSVEARKAGWRTVALFHLGEAGVPGYNILTHEATDDADGVTVTIPTDPAAGGEWAKAAGEVCSTMPAGLVLINGAEPESVLTERSRLDDHLWWLAHRQGAVSVIMGGLRYAVPDEVAAVATEALTPGASRRRPRGELAVEVPLGAVDLTPSREAVRDTARTRSGLRQAAQSARRRIADRWVAEVTPLPPTARVLASRSFFASRDATRLLGDLGLSLDLDEGSTAGRYRIRLEDGSWCTSRLDVSDVGTELWVLVTDDPSRHERVRYWVRQATTIPDGAVVVVTDQPSGTDTWLSWGEPSSLIHVATLDDLIAAARAARKARPKPKKAPAAPKPPVVYTVDSGEGRRVLTAEAINALDGPVVVTTGSAPSARGVRPDLAFLRDHGHHIVYRNSRTTATMAKRIPAGLTAEAALARLADRLTDGIDPVRLGDATRIDRRHLDRAVTRATQSGYGNAARILTAWSEWIDLPEIAVEAIRYAGRSGDYAATAAHPDRLPVLADGFAIGTRGVLALLDLADSDRVCPPQA